jgi:demethylmacrocin O-methyltransferase
MKTLSEIAKKYPTDKDFTHNYYNAVYEQYFSPIKDDVKLVCEVGIGGFWEAVGWLPGNSLKVWRDYFPNAEILGLDIVKHDNLIDLDRITIDWLDQSKRDLVIEYSSKLNNYDIIIDDGSHNVYDQQITFAHFFKSLKSGGIYVLEDLHSSIEVNIPEKAQLWGWGIPGFITPLEILEHFEKTGEIISDNLDEEEKKYLQDNIASVKVFHNGPTSITSVIVKK